MAGNHQSSAAAFIKDCYLYQMIKKQPLPEEIAVGVFLLLLDIPGSMTRVGYEQQSNANALDVKASFS
jgi:hypothetical protein